MIEMDLTEAFQIVYKKSDDLTDEQLRMLFNALKIERCVRFRVRRQMRELEEKKKGGEQKHGQTDR